MHAMSTRGNLRRLLPFAALAGIVLVCRLLLHLNPATVALALLLFVLVVAARHSLRLSVIIALCATASYNFFFLPPVGTFTIEDPQNWLALLAFLATSVIGSRLSQKARKEAEDARSRQRELEVLFSLSRELLQQDSSAGLIHSIPRLVHSAAATRRVTLYLLSDDLVQQAGEFPSEDVPELRRLALNLATPQDDGNGDADIPLRSGTQPRGLLRLSGVRLSADTLQAIGGLASVALDRAEALEELARSEATKEGERLRTLILDSMTHELKTPLTSIKAATGTLQEMQHVNADDRRDLLAVIDEEADRLNRLVTEAVEMAQIEARRVQMTFAPFDLRELVEEAQENCAWVLMTHRVETSLPPLPPVQVDGALILKVLCNLLENAAKYSEPETPIVISAAQEGDRIRVSVADEGIGIDPAEQELIFDRLYRSRTHSRQRPGTGMGLAISRAIVESHGGTLTVASEAGRGSVFTFSLPLAPGMVANTPS